MKFENMNSFKEFVNTLEQVMYDTQWHGADVNLEVYDNTVMLTFQKDSFDRDVVHNAFGANFCFNMRVERDGKLTVTFSL